jgi:hypothetical protein
MYADPAHIRKHRLNLSLSDNEYALLRAFCDYTGGQMSTVVREMVLGKAVEVLHVEANSASAVIEMRHANNALLAA